MSDPTSAQRIDDFRRRRLNSWLFWINSGGVLLNSYNYYRLGNKIFFALAVFSFFACWTCKD